MKKAEFSDRALEHLAEIAADDSAPTTKGRDLPRADLKAVLGKLKSQVMYELARLYNENNVENDYAVASEGKLYVFDCHGIVTVLVPEEG